MNDTKSIESETLAAVAGAAPCSDESPLCTDCKWMTRDSNDGTPLCKRPGNGEKNVVSGGMLYPACKVERADMVYGLFTFLISLLLKPCGPKAKYFEPNVESSATGGAKGAK